MEPGLLSTIKIATKRRQHRCGLNLHISVILLLITILTGYTIQAQRVITQPERITLVEGEKASLLCTVGVPIFYCRITIPGEDKVFVFVTDKSNKSQGITYYGAGLQAGQCGVTIENVSAKHHGQVKCSLGTEGEELYGVIDVTVALPPLRPEIEVLSPHRDGFGVDEPLTARCVVRDGRPPANIGWFIDNEPIYQGLNQQEIIENRDERRNTTLYTTAQEIQRHLTAEDNGKYLRCRAINTPNDNDPTFEGRLQLLVNYLPQPLPDIKVYGLTLDQTALVTVTIRANPRPRVVWTIDGVDIPQGTQNGRYESYEPVDIGNGAYNVTLSIAGLTLEDTTKEYHLKAGNGLGTQDYIVRVSSSDTPASQGLDIGAIVGIVVALLVLIMVVLLIIFARATGRWCFSAKSSKSPTSETSDTESAELKSTKARKFPTFEAIFKRKHEKNKSSTGQRETAESQNEDEQRLAGEGGITSGGGGGLTGTGTESRGNAGDGHDNEPKEDKQLVYAELVLKPSDDKPAPTKNTTEYAEIVYVQKQQQQQPQQQKGQETAPTATDQPPSKTEKK